MHVNCVSRGSSGMNANRTPAGETEGWDSSTAKRLKFETCVGNFESLKALIFFSTSPLIHSDCVHALGQSFFWNWWKKGWSVGRANGEKNAVLEIENVRTVVCVNVCQNMSWRQAGTVVCVNACQNMSWRRRICAGLFVLNSTNIQLNVLSTVRSHHLDYGE